MGTGKVTNPKCVVHCSACTSQIWTKKSLQIHFLVNAVENVHTMFEGKFVQLCLKRTGSGCTTPRGWECQTTKKNKGTDNMTTKDHETKHLAMNPAKQCLSGSKVLAALFSHDQNVFSRERLSEGFF
jgi:hypothetical protein